MSDHAIEFAISDTLIASLVALLITAVFVHVAAKLVVGESRYLQAVLAAFLGSLLAGLVLLGVQGIVGAFLAVAAWALVVALVYRTRWLAGAGIGLIAWLLWLGIVYLIRFLS